MKKIEAESYDCEELVLSNTEDIEVVADLIKNEEDFILSIKDEGSMLMVASVLSEGLMKNEILIKSEE